MGDTIARDAPTTVLGLSGVLSVSVYMSHVCAALSNQSAMCWGLGYDGQLGTGEDIFSSDVPVAVVGL